MIDLYTRQKINEYVDRLVVEEQQKKKNKKMLNKQRWKKFCELLADFFVCIVVCTVCIFVSVHSFINECWILFWISSSLTIIGAILLMINGIHNIIEKRHEKEKRRRKALEKYMPYFWSPDEEAKLYMMKL